MNTHSLGIVPHALISTIPPTVPLIPVRLLVVFLILIRVATLLLPTISIPNVVLPIGCVVLLLLFFMW